ncbi:MULTISPECIES: energy transducer TonB [unclassified Arenimonas]|uniref:energy transducer TonB n=1 Tax=unclassified Arenimonas TaxID=2641713 RepID=UPI000868934B|nr:MULTISPECIES: energy transducer TonB [unclassified Arenimonas]ODS62933.1 MAG: energy transducer TonB [Arenimonas sp. SCN 70-307]
MAEATARPAPSPGSGDRFGATLALSAILFGVLILGVGFALDTAAPVAPTLDIILTETRSDTPPEDADFIAQANNQGGGESERAERPREEQLAPVPKPEPGISPEPLVAQAPPPEPEPVPRLLATTAPSPDRLPVPEDQRDTEAEPLPSGQELIEQSLEMARLAAEIERRQELLAKRPKRKFVSASTREYEYAAYLRAWVAKVERVGNLNYPDEARRRGLSGRLVMTVAVRRDGTIEDVLINRSSGLGVLDQAALRIVRLAEPYPPLPETKEQVDVLHITRTWQFQNGSVLSD